MCDKGLELISDFDKEFIKSSLLEPEIKQKMNEFITLHESHLLTTRGCAHLHLHQFHQPRQHKELGGVRKVAITDLENAASIDKSNERPLYALASIYYGSSGDAEHEEQHMSKALGYIDEAISLLEDRVRTLYNENSKKNRTTPEREQEFTLIHDKLDYGAFYLLRAKIKSHKLYKQYNEAVQDYTTALAYNERDNHHHKKTKRTELHLERAICIINQHKDKKETDEVVDPNIALQDLQKCTNHNIYAHMHLSTYYFYVEKNPKQAINHLIKFKKLYTNDNGQSIMENKKEREELLVRVDQYIDHMNKEINYELHSDQSDELLSRAQDLIDQGLLSESLLKLNKAIELFPNQQVYLQRSLVYLNLFVKVKI
ncbi:hypothetical protein AKO1_013478 [Acrasis kona]|uniref:Uncharacterized protein n=1 Tax=Acrasis kona TaxID=1008807 RepID=A0AAW2ZI60_9EUKA